MKITIVQDSMGCPVVSVQGDDGNSPEAVATSYLEAVRILKVLKEDKTK